MWLLFFLKLIFVAQIETLNSKIVELKGVKRPNLKRVKKTTDDMLGAYTDTSKLMKSDFKAKLKTVKKEEEKVKLVAETIVHKIRNCVKNVNYNLSLFHRGKK